MYNFALNDFYVAFMPAMVVSPFNKAYQFILRLVCVDATETRNAHQTPTTVVFNVTVQVERCFRLMEHISVIS